MAAKKPTARKAAKKKAAALVDEKVTFYASPVIASILALLLRNATTAGDKFDSFDVQLCATRVMAEDLRRRGTRGGDAFERAVIAVKNFHDASDKNKETIQAAHIAIMNLLNALVETKEWDTCRFISQAKITQIANLAD